MPSASSGYGVRSMGDEAELAYLRSRTMFDEEVTDLKARIKELESELNGALEDGYEQALFDMRNVAHGVIEVTWAAGPAEGLQLLMRRLEEKDVIVTSPMGVPHDWLSRWEVRLK
jgi:hypothetical protein